LATAMENAKGQASVEIEQARLADKSEIEVLKTKLEQVQLVVREGRMQASQQRNLIEQLQARVEIVENKMIDIEMFKSQAIEIRSRIS
jgi:molybdate-binding protein